MNICCCIGLHKWTVLETFYWDMTSEVSFAELKLGCLCCGKTKVVRRKVGNE